MINFVAFEGVIRYLVILVANLAARAVEVKTLENLFHFPMHLLGRVPRKTMMLYTAPGKLSLDTVGAVEAVAVLTLHRIRLDHVVAQTTNKEVYCMSHG